MTDLTIIEDGKDDTLINFTETEFKTVPELPGVSLGNIIIFRENIAQASNIEPFPSKYKDGYIDRIFEIFIVASFLNRKELNIQAGTSNPKKIWLSIWHLLKDEFKQDSFVINISTGDISAQV